ncbi:arylformamidase [Halobacillus sp. ACCC02827]|uniref:arylformamidase n=1 Tax=Bacillaceae TaxID=186817 RepID=UPI0003FE28DA|nr:MULTISPECIES: arylformamidase [Bacillaceae]QHT48246.1 arylformamidase [Bacillus sp. SB49]WJE15483.1 arylformamidase [Halobacillus sp. ACCC02827]
MKLIDISMPLHEGTPPWPGDTPFHYEHTFTMKETGSVNVGQFQASNHIGTHVDAPYHYDSNGWRIAEVPLERYIGDALVLSLPDKDRIQAKDLEGIDLTAVTKVILQTKSWKDRTKFPNTYTTIGEDLAPLLREHGIDLIGVDTPSVDTEKSKALPGHHSLYANDILILEGLQLDHVSPGFYELMAFPLKMEDGDGSPVRAVLREK